MWLCRITKTQEYMNSENFIIIRHGNTPQIMTYRSVQYLLCVIVSVYVRWYLLVSLAYSLGYNIVLYIASGAIIISLDFHSSENYSKQTSCQCPRAFIHRIFLCHNLYFMNVNVCIIWSHCNFVHLNWKSPNRMQRKPYFLVKYIAH